MELPEKALQEDARKIAIAGHTIMMAGVYLGRYGYNLEHKRARLNKGSLQGLIDTIFEANSEMNLNLGRAMAAVHTLKEKA